MPSLPPYPGLEIESEERVWRGRYPVDLVRFRHLRFDGRMSGTRQWELFRRGQAAALLPYDPVTDEVVLIEQFRLPALAAGVEPVMVEIPAGLLDGDETPEAAVARETREEAGLDIDLLERIGRFVLTPGACDEACTMFVGRVRAPACNAEGLVGTAGLAAEDEDIRIRVLPAVTAMHRALAGEYPNSVTTLALLWLGANHERLRTEWLS